MIRFFFTTYVKIGKAAARALLPPAMQVYDRAAEKTKQTLARSPAYNSAQAQWSQLRPWLIAAFVVISLVAMWVACSAQVK